jgi:hypothetical protein
MSNPAQFRGARKGLRDAFQAVLAVVAAGGATVVVDLLIGQINSLLVGAVLTLVFKVLIAYAQNLLETAGKIPVLLPTPGLVSAALEPVEEVLAGAVPILAPPPVATVDAVVAETGEIAGTVVGVTGGVVGKVTGLLKRGPGGRFARAEPEPEPEKEG